MHSKILLTFSTANDERNIPRVAMNPPVNAVFLIPNLSTSILEIGDKRNVVPIAKEATRDAIVAAARRVDCTKYDTIT